MSLVAISRELARRVDALSFSEPVTHVYNPLVYAREPHEAYLRKYGRGAKSVLLLGMNPGPFGMAQTGVPFGEVGVVRDWLEIDGAVQRPRDEHPKRPVSGFACRRSEVSGARLWGWIRERFGSPGDFFDDNLVLNYCPLVFLEAGGRNRTPDKLKKEERRRLFEPCDGALRQVAAATSASVVVGVGRFAAARAAEALAGTDVTVTSVIHPSPANPAANRGWSKAADRAFEEARRLTPSNRRAE